MKRKDRQALAAYVRFVADRIELRDWTLVLEPDPPEQDIEAHIRPIFGRHVAYLRFSTQFRGLDSERQRYVVCHELVHLHLDRISTYLENGLDDLVGRPAHAVIWQRHREDIEMAVDGIAEALAVTLPFLDWSHRPKWTRAAGGRDRDVRIAPWGRS
jgi:hypothetical protein